MLLYLLFYIYYIYCYIFCFLRLKCRSNSETSCNIINMKNAHTQNSMQLVEEQSIIYINMAVMQYNYLKMDVNF